MKESKPAHKLLREWKRTREDGVLHQVVEVHGKENLQVILPNPHKNKILRSLHDSMVHQAVENTTLLTGPS